LGVGTEVPGAIVIFGGFGQGYEDDDDDENDGEEMQLRGEEEEWVDEDDGEEEDEEEMEEGEEEEEEEMEEDENDQEDEDEDDYEDDNNLLQRMLRVLKRSYRPPPQNPRPSRNYDPVNGECHKKPFKTQKRKDLEVVDSKVWNLHVGLQVMKESDFGDEGWATTRHPSRTSYVSPKEGDWLHKVCRVKSFVEWQKASTSCVDAGDTPFPPIPSPTLSKDLLALVPGGRELVLGDDSEGAFNEGVEDNLGEGVVEGTAKRFRREVSGGDNSSSSRAPPPPDRRESEALSFSDFSLKIGTHCLPSYSWLLRRHSPLISALLTNWNGQQSCISLGPPHDTDATCTQESMDKESAVRLLASICCGRLMITEDDHPSKAMALLVAAERLGLREVSRAAEALLMSFVGESSVCGLLQWADVFFSNKSEGSSLSASPSSSSSSSSSSLQPQQVPPSNMAKKLSIRDSTPGELLRASCVSLILRNFQALTSTEDFAALPEELRRDVLSLGASEGHAFAYDRKSTKGNNLPNKRKV